MNKRIRIKHLKGQNEILRKANQVAWNEITKLRIALLNERKK